MEKLITIVGPTAVGKTDLTLALAKGYNGEVISGDAYQVYKHLNIGTAKPTTDELATIPHYLINILEPDDDYSVSIFQQQAKSLINQLNELYTEYGVNGLREYAQNLAEKGGIEIKYTDKHRLYRAIELMTAGDYKSLIKQTKEGLSYKGPVIGLQRERSDLYNRINRRVEIMFEKGLVDEVKQLLKSGVNPNCQAFKGIGYKEVVQYLEGLISYDACVDLIQKNTRHFAKRQITWYKRMPYIEWITIDSQTTEAEIYGMACNIIDSSF